MTKFNKKLTMKAIMLSILTMSVFQVNQVAASESAQIACQEEAIILRLQSYVNTSTCNIKNFFDPSNNEKLPTYYAKINSSLNELRGVIADTAKMPKTAFTHMINEIGTSLIAMKETLASTLAYQGKKAKLANLAEFKSKLEQAAKKHESTVKKMLNVQLPTLKQLKTTPPMKQLCDSITSFVTYAQKVNPVNAGLALLKRL